MLSAATPKNVTRYAVIAQLLAKYGGSDWLRGTHLLPALAEGALPRATPDELAADLEAHGPTFVKIGQMLASRPDMLPPRWIQALQRLQTDVAPVPLIEIRQTVERELGASIDVLFASFEDAPIGAASIGQVHRATMRDGREVVVKVQRPGIRAVVLEDLDAFAHIAVAMQRHSEVGERYGTVGIVREFRHTLLAELDYEQEARNLAAMARLLTGYDNIVVPRPISDYTSHRVLTMDYIDGVGLADVHPVVFTELNRDALANELCQAYLDQILLHGFYHCDPHPGNLRLMTDRRIGMLDLGQVAHLGPDGRQELLQLLLAVIDGRGRDASSLLRQMGQALSGFSAVSFEQEVAEVVQTTSSPSAAEGRVGASLLALARTCSENRLRPPANLTTLGKTLLQLDEVARAVNPEADANRIIREYSASLMSKHAANQARPAELYHTLLEGTTFLRNAPGHLDRILDTAANDGLLIRTRIEALAEVLTAVRNVANRITVGLVLAATIIGAALIMPIETNTRLLGYPPLAVIMLVFAVLVGMGFVVSVLWSDWRSSRRQNRGDR